VDDNQIKLGRPRLTAIRELLVPPRFVFSVVFGFSVPLQICPWTTDLSSSDAKALNIPNPNAAAFTLQTSVSLLHSDFNANDLQNLIVLISK
jgi:hypothetical protein